VVALAKRTGWKTLVYFEFDDAGPDSRGEVSITVLQLPPGMTGLVTHDPPERVEILQALIAEARAEGWRQIAIVVDNDAITVGRGPSPGSIRNINERVRAEADRAFPGHTSYQRTYQPTD
jgi:hypothetical protein